MLSSVSSSSLMAFSSSSSSSSSLSRVSPFEGSPLGSLRRDDSPFSASVVSPSVVLPPLLLYDSGLPMLNDSCLVVNMSCSSLTRSECAIVPPILSLLCACVPYSLGTTPSASRFEMR